jgi:hypothetical protein
MFRIGMGSFFLASVSQIVIYYRFLLPFLHLEGTACRFFPIISERQAAALDFAYILFHTGELYLQIEGSFGD